MLNRRLRQACRTIGPLVLLALLLLLSGARPAGAAQTAPWVRASIVTNGGGDRLDATVQVATARPGRACKATARYAGQSARLPRLRTDRSGGRQWHWIVGDGAPKARMTVRVRCAFPDGKRRSRSVSATVGPGPFPRRRFRQVVQGLVREEAWTPPKRYDGSGGGAHLYPSGQCTWYVAQRRPDLPYFAGRAGDARNWLASAQRAGLPTGQAPAVGAVAVFQPGQYGAGFFGHVAFVTALRGGSIDIAEANFKRTKPGAVRRIPWAGLRFIYRERPPEPPSNRAPPEPVTSPAPPAVPPSPPIWPSVDLATAPTLRLLGGASNVARAGDVNGDGIDDAIVSASDGNANGRTGSGSAWVVFGRAGWIGDAGLWALGASGFRIDGAAAGDQAGRAIAAAGDLNGDGFDDVMVGAPMASNAGRPLSGSAYVVFGKPDSGTVDLADLGGRGYRIDGAAEYELTGLDVDGAGDVNRDGRPDLIVSADANAHGRVSSGTVYVLFGKADSRTVDLATLGTGGYRVDGAAEQDRAEVAANVGDLNGDGSPDLAIGAPNTAGGVQGRAWVVFGKPDSAPIDLRDEDLFFGAGFPIDGFPRGERLGEALSGVGDVNGDGLSDLAVGAAGASYNGRGYSGSTYVVFGKRDTYAVALDGLGAGGYRIDGAASQDEATVAGAAGDVNRDGLADLLVTSRSAAFAGRPGAGTASVVFGKRDGRSVDLASLGAGGYAIGGAAASAGIPSADGALDFNADGRPDALVGSSVDDQGAAYVVFGQPPPA